MIREDSHNYIKHKERHTTLIEAVETMGKAVLDSVVNSHKWRITMNRTTYALIALFVLATATVAAAKDAPSVERGSNLFNSTSLGTNGRSCATCHPGGKGLEDVADYDNNKLKMAVNTCIVKALKGKSIADNSPDLDSLVMYLNTFGTAKPK